MNLISRVRRKVRRLLKDAEEKKQFESNVRRVKMLAANGNYARKFIIDCGFNEGVVAGRLLNELPEFALRGFEIQQDIRGFFDDIKRQFPGRDIDVMYSAVSDTDGVIEYFEPETWGKNYKGGTTIVANKRAMGKSYDMPKTAPAINFSAWLQKEFTSDDFLFVKMDIEGGEYDVIESLMDSKAIDLISVLAVEWHAEKFAEPQASRYRSIEAKIKQYGQGNRITVLDWY